MNNTAIFCDYDNIHSAFCKDGADPRNTDAAALSGSASNWQAWIKNGCHLAFPEPRRIVLAAAYLNPKGMQRDRGNLVRSGFEVHDCPDLTSKGKNAADIAMTIHILDTLNSPHQVDEYVILSRDADFTPVLRKLRLAGKHTAIFGGRTAAAYRNVADTVINAERFSREALTYGSQSNMAEPESHEASVLKTTVQILQDSHLPVLGSYLGNALLQRHGAYLKNGNWFGHGGLRQWLEAVRHDSIAFTTYEGAWALAMPHNSGGGDKACRALKLVEPCAVEWNGQA